MILKELLFFIVLLACENKKPYALEPDPTQIMDTLYHFDLENPVVTQALDSIGKNPEQIKFVETEITRVSNPKEYPVLFSVNYISASGTSSLLGVFSLFPSTNPGVFIVPTKGMLRPSGKLELRLERPEDIKVGDVLSVEAKGMRLRKE